MINKKLLLFLVFIEGGIMMLLELTFPHLASPIIGNSISTWGGLISLAVGGLALGYFLGGYLSRKKLEIKSLIWLFFFLTLCSILIGTLLTRLIFNEGGFDLQYLKMWLVSTLFLLLPSVLLGSFVSITSFIIKIHDLEKRSAGLVFATSSAGGIIFTFLVGFYLIPNKGISYTVFVGCFLLLTAVTILTFQVKRKVYNYLFLFQLIFLFSLLFTSGKNQTRDINVLHFSEGLNGQLLVTDVQSKTNESETERILFINRMGQTWVNTSTGLSQWSYVNFVTSLASIYTPGSKCLVLGLGGGIVAKQLSLYTNHQVDVVEIDQKIVDISYDYFNLTEAKNVSVTCQDARRFINSCEKKYDFILMDIFNGELVPSHGLSLETFTKIKEILNPGGMVIVNFNGFLSGIEGYSGKALGNTMLKSGLNLKILPTVENSESERNNLYIGFLKEPDWSKSTINVQKDGKNINLSNKLIEFINKSGFGKIITDDFPMMEYLNQDAAKVWRKVYFENWTLRLKKQNDLEFFY